MPVHPFVSELLNDSVLPYVIHVHGLDIPYPAELWIGDVPAIKRGVVSLHVCEDGYLSAEYFAFDPGYRYDLLGMAPDREEDCRIVILDSRVELPILTIHSNKKTRTVYDTAEIPGIVGYECRISDWLGDPESEIDSATILMTDFPIVRMPTLTKNLPDRPLHKNISLRQREVSNAVLSLEAEEWIVQLEQPTSPGEFNPDSVTVANISRKDGASFVLDETDSGVLMALRTFLSFQCGAWVNTALIVCNVKDKGSVKANRALVGRLLTPGYQGISARTATDFETWPGMFARFWQLFRRPASRRRLQNAVSHYVSSSAVFQNSQSATYAIAPTRSALEALVKWWRDLPDDFQFSGRDGTRFTDLLLETLHKAKLGVESGRRIDFQQVERVVKQGTQFRNTMDHGSAGSIPDEELHRVIEHQQYLHNLARLLISAKLGVRSADHRGSFYFPKFEKLQPSPEEGQSEESH